MKTKPTKRRNALIGPQKALLWDCACGATNYAPAKQTPDNQVVCSECERPVRWGDIPKESIR